MNLITFTGFEPDGSSKINLQLSGVKIFGRNMDKGKVLKDVHHEDSIDLYFRSKENLISVIKGIKSPQDLAHPTVTEL